MDRINGAGHVDHMFVDQDAATNRPPTEFTADWFNGVQEELATFIEWAGLALSNVDRTQLRQALLTKFALLESPAMTGAPTAPTQPQFDNSFKLVTTAFLQRSLGNYRGVTNFTTNANQVLTVGHLGQLVVNSSTGGAYPYTVPLASACPAGSGITFLNNSGVVQSLSRSGADVVAVSGLVGGATTASLPYAPGDTVTLVSDGVSKWYVAGGTANLPNNGQFARNPLANGYMKMPGGIIFQWASGTNIAAAGNQVLTLPVAFPTVAMAGLVSNNYASAAQNGGYGLVSLGTTQAMVARNNVDNGNGVTPTVFCIGY